MNKKLRLLLLCVLAFTVLFTGCGKGSAYKKAVTMFENGQYEEARDAFAQLEDYEDSVNYVVECDYLMASALLEAGEYEASMTIFDTIRIYKDANARYLEAEDGLMRQTYAAVFQALNGKSWLFNGGADTVLNRISFTDQEATIDQVYFDGNGKQEGGSTSALYTLDDQYVTIPQADGSTLQISYVCTGDTVTIGNNEYFTMEQIEEGIQGYWKSRVSRNIVWHSESEKNICFDHGSVVSEFASSAYGGSKGEYYYYGPYEGSYTLNFGGFDTEIMHGSDWFYNIIGGKVAVLNYDHVCKPSDRLPGEHGYQF